MNARKILNQSRDVIVNYTQGINIKGSWIKKYIDGLVQDCSNFIANALDLLQSCSHR